MMLSSSINIGQLENNVSSSQGATVFNSRRQLSLGQKEGGFDTSGGVAIIYKDVLHVHKDTPHIPYKGYTWAAITVKLHGGYA